MNKKQINLNEIKDHECNPKNDFQKLDNVITNIKKYLLFVFFVEIATCIVYFCEVLGYINNGFDKIAGIHFAVLIFTVIWLIKLIKNSL